MSAATPSSAIVHVMGQPITARPALSTPSVCDIMRLRRKLCPSFWQPRQAAQRHWRSTVNS
jgi:hypothetical protein